jgi:hypothetical protein
MSGQGGTLDTLLPQAGRLSRSAPADPHGGTMTHSIASKTITCRLVVLLSAYFMAQFDFFVVNVAAPSFERSLGAGPVALELIVGG